MSAVILRPSFLSKAAKEDLSDLKGLHSLCQGTKTPQLELLNATLESFYNEVASGERNPAKLERRILDMKEMVHGFAFTGRVIVPAA